MLKTLPTSIPLVMPFPSIISEWFVTATTLMRHDLLYCSWGNRERATFTTTATEQLTNVVLHNVINILRDCSELLIIYLQIIPKGCRISAATAENLQAAASSLSRLLARHFGSVSKSDATTVGFTPRQ